MTVTDAAVPVLLHKNLPVLDTKVIDEERGIVDAYVAGIGNKDSVGDIIQPGAFADSLKVRMPKGVWSHNWDLPISKTLEIYEVMPGDPRLPAKMASRGVGGLYVKTQFNLKTQRGRDAFEDVKFFSETDEAEWSIGYMERESEFCKDLGANLLHKIDLYEYSPVLFGANPLTSTVGIKVQVGGEKGFDIQVVGLDDQDLEAKVADAVKGALDAKAAVEASEKAKTHPFMPGGDDGMCKICGKAKGDAVHDDGKAAESDTETKEDAASEGGRKVVPGSFEARSRAIREAVEDVFPGYNAWPVATFENSVVVEVYESYAMEVVEAAAAAAGEAGAEGSDDDEQDDKEGYWVFPYTLNADASVTLGEPQAVDVVEVIVAKIAMDQLGAKGQLSDEARQLLEEKVIPMVLDMKAGRVLSSKNLDRLTAAKNAIEEVLSSADAKEPESSGEEKGADETDVETKDAAGDEVETKSNAVCGQMFKAADGVVVPCEKEPGHEDVLHGVPEAAEKAAEGEGDVDAEGEGGEDEAGDEAAEEKDAEGDVETKESDEATVPAIYVIAESYGESSEEDVEAWKAFLASALDARSKASDDDDSIKEIVAALDAAVGEVISAADAGETVRALEQLSEADARVSELVAVLEASDPEEKDAATPELVELDSATLLELEIILADV